MHKEHACVAAYLHGYAYGYAYVQIVFRTLEHGNVQYINMYIYMYDVHRTVRVFCNTSLQFVLLSTTCTVVHVPTCSTCNCNALN